jgi:hypothetical protein
VSAQPAAREIVVADCSEKNPADELKREFSRVRFLHFRQLRTIPQLRWAAYAKTTGDVIAATEGRCVPAPDWCEMLDRAHAAAPDVPAIGGPIAVRDGASAFDTGVYFCEYGWHCPPTDPVVRLASGANISYKRAALEEARDLVEAGAWETELHERWLRSGLSLHSTPALVTFENAMDAPTALAQRFHYGRGYGADRLPEAAMMRRIAYAGGCAALPALMVWRLGQVARRRSRFTRYLRSWPWITLLSFTWSAGEMTGYIFGRAREKKVF